MDRLCQLLEGDTEIAHLVLPLISTGLIEIGTELPPPVLACGAHLLASIGAAAACGNDRWSPQRCKY